MKYSALLAALLLSACGGGGADYVSEYRDGNGNTIRCETDIDEYAGTGKTVCEESSSGGGSSSGDSSGAGVGSAPPRDDAPQAGFDPNIPEPIYTPPPEEPIQPPASGNPSSPVAQFEPVYHPDDNTQIIYYVDYAAGGPYVVNGVCYVPPGGEYVDKNNRVPDPCGLNGPN